MNKKLIALAIAVVLGLGGCIKSPLEKECEVLKEQLTSVNQTMLRAGEEDRKVNTPESNLALANAYVAVAESSKSVAACTRKLTDGVK